MYLGHSSLHSSAQDVSMMLLQKTIANLRGTGLTALTSSTSSAMTTARPACKCQSMWQWKNQGPGLSACQTFEEFASQLSGSSHLDIQASRRRRRPAHLEADRDVVSKVTASVHDVAPDGVLVVRLCLSRAPDDREGVLPGCLVVSPTQARRRAECIPRANGTGEGPRPSLLG